HGPNDEALVLEENLPDVPHLQGPDRVALAQTAIEELEAELLILDDGFQHRRLHRDLDIVLVDATNPWGYGRLFPRGLLREPKSSLRRADAVIITKCPQPLTALHDEIKALVRDGVPIVFSDHRPVGWQRQSDRTTYNYAAFCGLGNPESFRTTLHG